MGSIETDSRVLRRVQRQASRIVQEGFKGAMGVARLTNQVTPHTLRRTAATWPMQRGVPVLEATVVGLEDARERRQKA